ncbi:MAG TPA: DUF1572 family protein [Pyrinomonadaceae bacterium]|jgi:hypothetical protein|nr:DUF1572 family protein [Pyrinomonadaceae bacterium]
MSSESIIQNYLADALSAFRAYKELADKAIEQTKDDELFVKLDDEANSIAIVMKHMAGNMISRWTDFLSSDGEKPDRNRDMEFVMEAATSKEDLLAYWERGWKCVFDSIEPLKSDDLERKVLIRGQEHTIVQAINRQLMHYSYHIGQIVFLAKHFRSSEWRSLSIPRNRSAEFNKFLDQSGDRTADREKQFDAVVGFAKAAEKK